MESMEFFDECKDLCIRSGNKDLCLEIGLEIRQEIIWSHSFEPWKRGFLLDAKIIAREKGCLSSSDLQRPRKVIKAWYQTCDIRAWLNIVMKSIYGHGPLNYDKIPYYICLIREKINEHETHIKNNQIANSEIDGLSE